MGTKEYQAHVWAGMKEGVADNARTAISDLQSTYHEIHTGAPRVGQPSARSGTMEFTEGKEDVYQFGPPVLETDPAPDFAAQAELEAPEPTTAPEIDVER